MTQCPHCKWGEVEEDAARGEATCTKCGTVLEESFIVSEVTFQETAGGGSGLIGQFVSVDRPQPTTLQGIKGLVTQDSREITYYKGKKIMLEIASQLSIKRNCVDTAFNLYKMCVCRNLTRGRQRLHVAAACLYMTCRLENIPHLLLDFSDVTQVNVYDLGRTLSCLARALHINLPNTDPCLYILRFAVMLDFGEKQRDVVSLSTRIVQRMKRDWMSTGRRPTGICGAALLLAARSYNFNRTVNDIVRIVHVSESVVRKRLYEFSRTPSANVTIDEFNSIDLEQAEDPPAYREARRRAREKLKIAEEEKCEKAEKEIAKVETELEKALEVKRKERFRHNAYAKLFMDKTLGFDESLIPISEQPTSPKADEEDRLAEHAVQNEFVDYIYKFSMEEGGPSASSSTASLNNTTYARPSTYSLGLHKVEKIDPFDDSQDLHAEDDGELDLQGIDDREIDTYLLSEKESKLKEKYWMKMNGEHMARVEKRKREKEEEKMAKEEDGPKPKQKVFRRKEIIASTAQEAMEKVIIEKKLSNKINFDVLRSVECNFSQ
ncbi:hypothetical protein QR680_003769 [Steinernema hermaphroditum]|uniref:B-related factor 1 n=1 Tax=Steinernema hermaphroditum TaxID=289476 RepID=A0AA39LSW4_9BILA|nr:hypothetical protein QR680_003769 [Steinernema hermaphroditum]